MKKIISNIHGVTSYRFITDAVIQSSFGIIKMLSGAARGVDAFGEDNADNNSIAIRHLPADGRGCGKSADLLRNIEMDDYAEALITVRRIESQISEHMLEYVKQRALTVYYQKIGLGQIDHIRTIPTQ